MSTPSIKSALAPLPSLGRHWNLCAPGLFFPMEIRAYISAATAASLTGKPRLQIGQPDVIRPPVAADRRPMRAVIVRAVDQQAANARGAHFGQSYFLRAAHPKFASSQSLTHDKDDAADDKRCACRSRLPNNEPGQSRRPEQQASARLVICMTGKKDHAQPRHEPPCDRRYRHVRRQGL
jgi:hypothetical protein